MSLVYSAFVPHPPIVIPEIGRGKEKICGATLRAYRELAARVKQAAPDTLVIVSPHAPLVQEGVVILADTEAKGSFAAFGVPGISLSLPTDLKLVEDIKQGLPKVLSRKGELDHGALVPLYFFRQAGWEGKVVVLGMPLTDPERYGAKLGEILRQAPEKIALIASGDLSHRLKEDGPYGFSPAGPQFDAAIQKGLVGNPAVLREIRPEIVEEAGECGYRSLRMALAVQEGSAEILSYEGPFGVGYLVAELYRPSPLAHWARRCLTETLRGQNPMSLPQLPGPEFQRRGGCFVTLKKSGELRGCIGTTQPYQQNLAAEIAHNAAAAGTEDPRFWPVEVDELPDIIFSVDVLGELEKIESEAELDPWHYGVVVRGRGRTGLLLPHLQGVDTVAEQMSITRQKAGLPTNEPVEMWRFEVVRHYE